MKSKNTSPAPVPSGGRKRHRARNTVIAAAGVVAAVIVAAGVASGSAGGKPAASHSPAAPAAESPAPSNSPVAPGGASPAPSHASARPAATPSPTGTLRLAGNVALPDSKLTPGAVFGGVTVSQVCTPGWAEAHRDVPKQVKYAVFAEYGLPYQIHYGYEVDHLIPLELGGSNSIRNLWPEPQGGSGLGYPSKDRLENRLHSMVCDGQITLANAQQAISTNWVSAYHQFMSPATVPSAAPAPAPATTAPAPAPSTPAAPPPASCHPTTSSGNCYRPGEFCPAADHGMTGVTGNGEAIICENNNGWRWEPA